MIFLVAKYWRGAMNVDSMRMFTDVQKAYGYAKDCGLPHARLYAVHPDGPPENILASKASRKQYGLPDTDD